MGSRWLERKSENETGRCTALIWVSVETYLHCGIIYQEYMGFGKGAWKGFLREYAWEDWLAIL